jgi:hypothetical protein
VLKTVPETEKLNILAKGKHLQRQDAESRFYSVLAKLKDTRG